MRLPKRFRNRWTYAGAAALGVILFLSLWTGSILGVDEGMAAMTLGLIVSAAGPALLYWPRWNRSRGRMAIAGVLVVLSAFLLFLPVTTLFSAIAEGIVATATFWKEWFTYVPASFAIAILGSIFTFGLPYLIGILLSILFADEGGRPDD